MGTENQTNELLARIATALENLTPAAKPVNDLEVADAYV